MVHIFCKSKKEQGRIFGLQTYSGMVRGDAEHTYNLIRKELKSMNIDITKCIGSSMDGATVMSGKRNGVQVR